MFKGVVMPGEEMVVKIVHTSKAHEIKLLCFVHHKNLMKHISFCMVKELLVVYGLAGMGFFRDLLERSRCSDGCRDARS